MDAQKIAKQIIYLQKTMFDNTYNAMTVMQDHSENMLNGFLKQFPWVTEEVRKPLTDSLTLLKGARNNCKKAADQGFEKISDMVKNK